MKKETFNKTVSLNEEVTVHSFIHHIKDYIKKLLNDPIYAKPDDFLISNGLDAESLKKELEDCNLIIKKTRIVTQDNKDKFAISYTLSKENGERKIRRLYSKLFEQNIVEGVTLNETDCMGALCGGGDKPTAGTYDTKLTKNVNKRTIYISPRQYDMIREEVVMNTPIGDFGYDAPPFKKKKDPAYNHKNMMKKSFNNE